MVAASAVLSLLSILAADVPVLCWVDDAQWLDAESGAVLGFAARRLAHEPIMLLLSGDGEVPSVGSLPAGQRITVPALTQAEAIQLIEAEYGQSLAPHVRDLLVTFAGGNPSVLIDAPLFLTDPQRSGGEPIPVPLGTTRGLSRTQSERLALLSDEARAALLTASASGTSTMRVIAPAIANDADVLLEAENLGLVELTGGRIRFTSLFLASVVYQRATPQERRAAHRRIAEAMAREPEYRDRSIWHLAASVSGPDAETADLLAFAALAPERTLGPAAIASLLETSARLCVDTTQRSERTQTAARHAWAAGQLERARGLVDAASKAVGDGTTALDQVFVRGELASAALTTPRWPADVVEIVTAGAVDHPAVAMATLLAVARTASDSARSMRASQVALALASDLGPPYRSAARVAAARSAWLSGDAVATDRELVAADVAWQSQSNEDWPAELVYEGLMSMLDWEPPNVAVTDQLRFAWHELAQRRVTVAVAPGVLAQALADVRHGRWDAAAEGFVAAQEMACDTEQFDVAERARLGHAALAALRDRSPVVPGDVGLAAARSAQRAIDAVRRLGLGEAESAARTFSDLDVVQAQHWLPPTLFSVVDVVEAALRSDRGTAVDVRDALRDLPLDAARQAWVRGLTSDDYRAPLTEALEAFTATTDLSYAAARIHLTLGMFLRRDAEQVQARPPLREAQRIFERLGAEGWAAQTRHELALAGGTVRRTVHSGNAELTTQERAVANLIARGATNKETAAALFIAPSTVEYHLTKIYRKLGISSKQELAARLDALGSPS